MQQYLHFRAKKNCKTQSLKLLILDLNTDQLLYRIIKSLNTLRKDIKTDGRHAELKQLMTGRNSKRRDFTINAIYLNKKGKIFDPQLGINDLKNTLSL